MQMVEAFLISEFEHKAKVLLPRLAMIEGQEGQDRERVMELAQQLIDQGQEDTFRGILYRAFIRSGSSRYFCKLLDWHSKEGRNESDSNYGLQTLEQAILNNAGNANAAIAEKHFIANSTKLFQPSMRWLMKRASASNRLLQLLRTSYVNCQFDLETLDGLARERPAMYNLLVGVGEHNNNRLDAKKAISILDFQVPQIDKPIRRPELVPYYGQILEWQRFSRLEFGTNIVDLASKYLLHIDDIEKTLIALLEYECVVLAAKKVDDGKTFGLIAAPDMKMDEDLVVPRPSHRRRQLVSCPRNSVTDNILVGVIVVPNPQAWNLLPKTLMSAEQYAPFRAASLRLKQRQ